MQCQKGWVIQLKAFSKVKVKVNVSQYQNVKVIFKRSSHSEQIQTNVDSQSQSKLMSKYLSQCQYEKGLIVNQSYINFNVKGQSQMLKSIKVYTGHVTFCYMVSEKRHPNYLKCRQKINIIFQMTRHMSVNDNLDHIMCMQAGHSPVENFFF